MQKTDKIELKLAGFGLRLRHERVRLDWTQGKMAEIGGVSRITQGRYERNQSYPDLVYLSALMQHGVNFLYLCCGITAVELVRVNVKITQHK